MRQIIHFGLAHPILLPIFALVLAANFCHPAYSHDMHRDTHDSLAEILAHYDVVPTLINGTPAQPGQYPATVRSRQGSSACTATVIGERTLLHAAHCMSNGGSATFSVNGVSYTSRCTHHANYRGNSTADWALCLIDKKVTGIKYERIAKTGFATGTRVRLTGYGCVRPGGGGGNDGTLRIGDATVIRIPSGNNHDTVTNNGAALCFGDSGGPAFIYRNGGREVFGVNSRGDIRTTSYLSSTYIGLFRDWAASWARGNQTTICGVSDDAVGCNGDDSEPPPPPPPPPPVDCRQLYEQFAFCIGSTGIAACSERADKLLACAK